MLVGGWSACTSYPLICRSYPESLGAFDVGLYICALQGGSGISIANKEWTRVQETAQAKWTKVRFWMGLLKRGALGKCGVLLIGGEKMEHRCVSDSTTTAERLSRDASTGSAVRIETCEYSPIYCTRLRSRAAVVPAVRILVHRWTCFDGSPRPTRALASTPTEAPSSVLLSTT
ncbi:hypothetical protein BDV95DRAFT_158341 [Massariosphaeria phaeospora]|uniref:Uncharacterized protein n=1 Tax=Massariosphaeria phaeospora TaxID=100035 RepID=A0A7C8MIS4_9PLEO|nr:hypothetical protein BDV95DRAFT_158341 [Massariosphaeria phaeospora]